MLIRKLFGIEIEEARSERHDFPAESAAGSERLARIAEYFLTGYHRALAGAGPAELAAAVEAEVPFGWRGFGHEGVGFGLALRDVLRPWRSGRRSRLRPYLEGPGARFRHVVLAGAGWSFAWRPFRPHRALARIAPVLHWLAFDGYGFRRAFFGWQATVGDRRRPRRLRGYARRAFDLGVGRCLWFGHGMAPQSIASAIGRFPQARRDALWSGVGLAATYAGGGTARRVAGLREVAGRQAPDATLDLALGAAFAAYLQDEAGEVTDWAEAACSALCGRSVAQTTELVRRARAGLPAPRNGDAAVPVYERWRRATRAALAR